jgi:F-type H+-transporting ATPase subunit delta
MKNNQKNDEGNFTDAILSYFGKESISKNGLPNIQVILGQMSAKAKKERVAHVVSSIELTQNEKKMIERILTERIGHPISVECVISRDILGGFRIQIGDWIIDTTLTNQLNQMVDILKQ